MRGIQTPFFIKNPFFCNLSPPCDCYVIPKFVTMFLLYKKKVLSAMNN